MAPFSRNLNLPDSRRAVELRFVVPSEIPLSTVSPPLLSHDLMVVRGGAEAGRSEVFSMSSM